MGIDHTPDMPLDRWVQALRSLPPITLLKHKALAIAFTGGEPTLVTALPDFIRVTRALAPYAAVSVASNASTPQIRRTLAELAADGVPNSGGPKPYGQPVSEFYADIFLSPVDTGMARQAPCRWGLECGVSVDAVGMTPCPIGGMLDGVMKLGVRTWDWTRLDWDRLMALCRHCGRGLGSRRRPASKNPNGVPVYDVHGFAMTREWKDAVDAWKQPGLPALSRG
jgi:hypothetical protein